MSDIYIMPNPTGPTRAVVIDEDVCIGCNSCANICRIQTILPNPEKGRAPIVAYPDECWYCGCCVEACPTGALQMVLPINQRVMFKDKESGEIFRIGTQEVPAKSFFKAPFGWIDNPTLGKIMKELEKAERPVCAILPADAGLKIGRYFGEKEERDNTEKLVQFMKKVGFAEVHFHQKDDLLKEALEKDAQSLSAKDAQQGDLSDITPLTYSLSVKDASVLLHRLCVSNFTAREVWNSLKG